MLRTDPTIICTTSSRNRFWVSCSNSSGPNSADNEGRFFAGAGAGGRVEESLLVGTSLNSATAQPHPDEAPTAFASYHSSFDLTQNLIVGFPLVAGQRSGAFAASCAWTESHSAASTIGSCSPS